jgi:hypothetical protein
MKINILSYLLDVGSVILGKGDTQNFRFLNPSKYQLRQFSQGVFDVKTFRTNNINVNPEKIPKLAPDQETKLQWHFTAKRNPKVQQSVQFKKEVVV